MINISEIKTGAPDKEKHGLEGKVHQLLNELKIDFWWVDNDEVSSMEECIEINNSLGAEIVKTVFLCNRQKTIFYLMILPPNKPFDSKAFSAAMNAPRLSFASGELMEQYLGVTPGSATIMGLINDTDNNIELVIDKDIAEKEWFACNPGTNKSHIKLKTSDLLGKVLPSINHIPKVISL